MVHSLDDVADQLVRISHDLATVTQRYIAAATLARDGIVPALLSGDAGLVLEIGGDRLPLDVGKLSEHLIDAVRGAATDRANELGNQVVELWQQAHKITAAASAAIITVEDEDGGKAPDVFPVEDPESP